MLLVAAHGVFQRPHRLLAELVPRQSKKNIPTGQAKTILATVRPRDVAGKTRRRLAADQVADLVTVEKEIKAMVLSPAPPWWSTPWWAVGRVRRWALGRPSRASVVIARP
jgi:hypothetical protein